MEDLIIPFNAAKSEFAPVKAAYKVFDYSELTCRDEWKAIRPADLAYYKERFEVAETRKTGNEWGLSLEIRIIHRMPKVHTFSKKIDAKKFVKENYERLTKAEAVYNLLCA